MKNKNLHINGAEKPTFIFMSGEAIEQAASEAKESVRELDKKVTSETEAFEHIRKNYSKEAFQKELGKIAKAMEGKSAEKNKLIGDAVERYKKVLAIESAKLKQNLDDLDDQHEEAVENLVEHIHGELDLLKEATLNLHAVKEAEPKIEDSISGLKEVASGKLPLSRFVGAPNFRSKEQSAFIDFQSKMENQFEDYVDALNTQYLNEDWQESHLTKHNFEQYEEAADSFSNGMEAMAKHSVEHILKTSETTEQLEKRFKALKKRLQESYQNTAKQDGIIDVKDIISITQAPSLKDAEIMKLAQNMEGNEGIVEKLEQLNFLSEYREAWQEANKQMLDTFITDVEENGTEKNFMEAVAVLTGKLGKRADFSDAEKVFREEILLRAKVGVRETLEALEQVNQKTNGERAEILNFSEVEPKSLRYRAIQERDLLIARKNIPKGIYDKAVVEFVSANRSGKDEILNNPKRRTELFKGIANMRDHYEKEVGKVSEKEAAKLHALIATGKEAEWALKNMDQSDAYQNQELINELNQTDSDSVPPAIDLNFRNINQLFSTEYVSEVSRGGFNGRDLLLGIGKVWAGATIFMNVMNARKANKLSEAPAILLQNPYMYIAGAAWWTIDRYKENPEVKNYLSESEGGQERISTHLGLTKLSKKTGRERLQNFINKENEFAVIEDLMEEGKQGKENVRRLLEQARKRNIQNPQIFKEDLEPYLKTETYLPFTEGDANMRYRFYDRFLRNEAHAPTLRKNCKEWS